MHLKAITWRERRKCEDKPGSVYGSTLYGARAQRVHVRGRSPVGVEEDIGGQLSSWDILWDLEDHCVVPGQLLRHMQTMVSGQQEAFETACLSDG